MKEILSTDGFYGVSYLFLTLVVAGIAQGKNRSGLNWWLLATFFSPPVAMFFLVVFSPKIQKKESSETNAEEN